MMSFTQSLQKPVEGLAVTGEAARNTAAEMVEVCFEVHGAGASAPIALQDNAMRSAQVTRTLTSNGIPQADVQSGAPSIRPILQPAVPAFPPSLPLLPNAFASQSAAPMFP